MKQVTILCPVFNEEENIVNFVEKFDKIISSLDYSKIKFNFLFLDNCSTDNSKNILIELSQRNDVNFLSYVRNYGVMKSIYFGLITNKK